MPEMIDKDAPQGLSWSWDLDFDTLVAAAADAAAAAPAAGGSAASPSDTSPGPSGPPDADSPRADSPGADPCPAGSSGDAAGATAAAGREAGLDDAAAEQDDLDNPDDLDGPDGLEGPDGADGTGQRLPATALTGRVAERLAPGPDLAAWLAMAPAAALDDHDLAAVAGSWRRVAAWAQARELAAVAQIASRAAARDKDIGTGPDGRPARVPASAAAEVSLELTMSQYGASWWTDLAVTLGWRLAATGAALDAGELDLSRARLIAEATGALSDEASRAVEERVLPAAGEQTTGMLRAALRRAVIAADPQGAEERRKESERRAKVVLYPDEENTATLAGQRLPTVHAAAAMARIKAMARALKASGAGGGMDLLCAQVYVGLLLGTLPLIPPAQGAPPDDPPAPPGADPPGPPGGSAPPGPPGDVPGQSPPRGPGQSPPRGSGSPDAGPGEPSGDNPDGHDPGAARAGGPGGHPDDRQSPGLRDGASAGPPRRNAAPPRDSPAGQGPRDCPPASGTPPGDDPPASGNPPSANDPPPHGMPPPGQDPPTNDIPLIRQDRRQAGSDPPAGDTPAEGVPPPGDADAPHHEDDYPCPDDGPVPDNWVSPGKDDDDDRWPAADWPALPTVIPPAFARPGPWANNASTADDRPSNGTRPGGGRSGLLDVSLPWQVLAGISAGPGHLGRIGPVTATQARRIAECAAGDPGAEWRIIVTTPEGAALAVTRIPRPGDLRRARHPGLDPGTGTAARSGTAPGIGMVSRVTLTIPEDLTTDPPPSQGPGAGAGPESAGDILDLAVRAAARAAAGARAAAAADAAAGGCAHGAASSSYRPPPRLQDYIAARDLTCRFLGCRQPAWRGDLDHTIAFDDGGLTCRCNLGGLCRTHHIIKHHPDWKLEQLAPGIFRWTTPSGRTFTATPDTHLV